MAELRQQPAEARLVGVAGDEFKVTIPIEPTGAWSGAGAQLLVADATLQPTVDEDGSRVVITWTAAQTERLADQPLGWNFAADVATVGRRSLVAGSAMW